MSNILLKRSIKKSEKREKMFSLQNYLTTKAVKRVEKLNHREEKRHEKLHEEDHHHEH